MSVLSVLEPRQRKYLPEELRVTVWSKLKPYYNELAHRDISAVSDLERWIYDWNEINALVREEISWRYIHLSRSMDDERPEELYNYIVQRILPKVTEMDHALHIRLLESPFKNELNTEQFGIYLRGIQNSLAIYQPENVLLFTAIKIKSKEYGKLVSQMMIEKGGKNLTIQETTKSLESLDRRERESGYKKIGDCFLESEQQLDGIFNELVSMRNQLAKNAGFDNFRDFRFRELGRFDYTVKDCERFHKSIKQQVVPIVNDLYKLRKKILKLDTVRPWDIKVAVEGTDHLEPFKDTEDLVKKTIHCLSGVHPFFGNCLTILQEMKHLDLETRKGKQPGGYNMPLLMTGVPFVFMNASNSLKDLLILTHECGHAVHSFSTRQYQLNSIKTCPAEVAELAAMSMELFAMEHWDVIFNNPEEERIARLQQLERVLTILPWIGQVDEFQHWVYTHPDATEAERKIHWKSLSKEYTPDIINMSGCEKYIESSWHRQLHIFELPFYYIEYAMAQLGAIALWKNYRENPVETIDRFTYALGLGYSKTIPEIYEAAGISFDFSEIYIRSIIGFLREEIDKCYFKRETLIPKPRKGPHSTQVPPGL
ncbi:MAG: oligoendopeptidase F [Saprospiraceae bacterium]|jgi:oligoendopeptidase F